MQKKAYSQSSHSNRSLMLRKASSNMTTVPTRNLKVLTCVTSVRTVFRHLERRKHAHTDTQNPYESAVLHTFARTPAWGATTRTRQQTCLGLKNWGATLPQSGLQCPTSSHHVTIHSAVSFQVSLCCCLQRAETTDCQGDLSVTSVRTMAIHREVAFTHL